MWNIRLIKKKSRKLRNDRKDKLIQNENYNVEYEENSRTNTSRMKKKDVEILPTILDESEHEEKEETGTAFNDIGKVWMDDSKR